MDYESCCYFFFIIPFICAIQAIYVCVICFCGVQKTCGEWELKRLISPKFKNSNEITNEGNIQKRDFVRCISLYQLDSNFSLSLPHLPFIYCIAIFTVFFCCPFSIYFLWIFFYTFIRLFAPQLYKHTHTLNSCEFCDALNYFRVI